MRCGDEIWHTRSTWPMSMPSSSEAVATSTLSLPVAQPLLGVEALLLREAAVVRGDELGAEPLGQLVRHALGEPPRVHHDERRAVRLDQLDQALVDLLPDLVRHHRFERRARHFDGEVDLALVAAVDDRAFAGSRRRGSARPPRSASASPTARCAGACARTRARGARATARGARRGATRAPRGSRRRSRRARSSASRASAPR